MDLVLSNSEINTFLSCRRRWWLQYYLGLKKKDDGSEATGPLNYGTIIHSALEGWYVPDESKRIDPRIAIEEIYSSQEDVVLACGADMDKYEDNRKSSIFLIGEYMRRIEDGLDDGLEYVSAEATVGVEIAEGIRLRGKLDAVVRRVDDGAEFIMDHKTSRVPEDNIRLAQINPQFLGYMAAYRASFGGYLSGTMINIFRKVKTNKTKKEIIIRETVRYNRKETDNYIRRLEVIGTEIKRVRDQLDNGEDPTLVAYPHMTNDCTWICPFFSSCHMFDDGSYWEEMLDKNYEKHDANARYEDVEDA